VPPQPICVSVAPAGDQLRSMIGGSTFLFWDLNWALAYDDVRLAGQFTWRKESKILRDFLSLQAGATHWYKGFEWCD
jgi:hypothetical protein